MDISECLDDECDVKAVFEEIGELGVSVLTISLEGVDTRIRIHPNGIKKLKKMMDFVETNNLIIG